jgi:putative FmdB family regulatory protein
MPTYEYRCKSCDQHFTEVQTLSEHAQARPECPKCHGHDVELVYSAVSVKTSRKA